MHCAILFSRKKEFACQRNSPSCSRALAIISTDRCCTTARSWRVSADTRSAQSAIRRCRPVCAASRRRSSRRLSFAAAPRPNSCPELRPINTDSSCLSLKVSERQLRRSAPPGFLSPQQVYYTPVENSFAYFRREGLVFHGTADPWARTEVVKNECRRLGLPLFLVENADHSLETADTLHDLETLHRVIARTAQYLDER